MKNLLIVLILMLCSVLSIEAQKFGDISDELLTRSFDPIDSTAHATYIRKNASVYYDFNRPRSIVMVTEYNFVIKVYDEEGESYANFDIPIYKNRSSSEKVSKIKAVAVNFENGKAVKTKLNKKDIFKEKTSENWESVKFAVPNVKKGTVLEVKYTFSTPYIRTIPKWYFQNYIPTKESIYKIRVPQYFTLTPVPTGTFPLQMDKREVRTSKHGEMEYMIVGHNVPGIKEDKYVLNENDYRAGIKYEIMSTQFPNSTIEYYSKDWNEIAIDLMSAKYFGDQLKKKFKELKPVLAEAANLPKEEKIKYLYDYVRTTYAWNGKYGIGSYDGLKKVLENKSGSIGDLNLLLLNLLQKSDVSCNPFVMSARSSGILNTAFPSMSSLNYLVAYVHKGTDYVLLDASSKLSPMGELPVRATNINGVLLDKGGARVVDLDYDNKFIIQTVANYTLDLDNNKIVGSCQRKRSNYAATSYRLDMEKKKDENQQEKDNDDDEGQDDDIESYDLENTYVVTEAKNINDIYKPIVLKYDEELIANMKQIGDKIFLDATLDFGIKKNPFDQDSRDFPIFFNYKVHSESVASIEIPEGYHVEYVPKNIRVNLPNKEGSFHYTTSVVANKLGINYKFKINEPIIQSTSYAALKAIYGLLTDTNSEKIILSKGEKITITGTGNQE